MTISFDFGEAIRLAKQGIPVKRKTWFADESIRMILFHTNEGAIPILGRHFNGAFRDDVRLSSLDLLAEDWMEADT